MKSTLVVVVVLALVAVGFVGILVFGGQFYGETPVVEKAEPVEEALVESDLEASPAIDRSTPEKTVTAFVEQFITGAPPEIDQTANQQAFELLAEAAKSDLSQPVQSGELARLIGLQDIPDQGFSVNQTVYTPNPATGEDEGLAEVSVTFKFSGGDSERVFLVSKIGDQWQIDGVQLPD